MYKHFKKVDRHMTYDLLIIVAIISFFTCFILLKLVGNLIGEVFGGGLALIGVITLVFALIDYVRQLVKLKNK